MPGTSHERPRSQRAAYRQHTPPRNPRNSERTQQGESRPLLYVRQPKQASTGRSREQGWARPTSPTDHGVLVQARCRGSGSRTGSRSRTFGEPRGAAGAEGSDAQRGATASLRLLLRGPTRAEHALHHCHTLRAPRRN